MTFISITILVQSSDYTWAGTRSDVQYTMSCIDTDAVLSELLTAPLPPALHCAGAPSLVITELLSGTTYVKFKHAGHSRAGDVQSSSPDPLGR